MLYQKGSEKIEIIIRKEGGGAESQGAKEVDTDKASTEEIKDSQKENTPRRNKINTMHILNAAKQISQLSLNYVISGIGNKAGDEALQDIVERKVEIVTDITGFASSVVTGAVYGSLGGPVGTVIGVSLAAVSSTASLISKYATREREFNFKVFKENNAIEYKRARAGINLTTGRLR